MSRETVRRTLRQAKIASPQKRCGAPAHPDRLPARCHQSGSGSTLSERAGKHTRLSIRLTGHGAETRYSAELISRPTWHLPAQRQALDIWKKNWSASRIRLDSAALSKNSACSGLLLFLLKLKAESSAAGAPFKIVSAASCGSCKRPRWKRPTGCFRLLWRSMISASLCRLVRQPTTSARCRANSPGPYAQPSLRTYRGSRSCGPVGRALDQTAAFRR